MDQCIPFLRRILHVAARFVLSLALCGPVFAQRPAAAQPPAPQPARRPITVDDYFQVPEVTEPEISADGQWIAYTVTTSSLKEDKEQKRIWTVAAAGGSAIAMTAEAVSSSHPRWSPDGRYLAFLSKRGAGKTQVWSLDRRGGEAQRLTDTVQDVDDFAWSPDSKRLVLVLRDPSPEDLQAASERQDAEDSADSAPAAEKKPKTPAPKVVDRYTFKLDEVGYLNRQRSHLYVFDLAAKSVTQITSGDFDDERPAWSPDGKLIAFGSNRSLPDPDRTYDSNIWVVAADNRDRGARLTQVTTNPGADETPAWSPDGNWITYVTQVDPKLFLYATRHIAVSPARGGEARILTKSLDRMASDPLFSPDGKFVYFIADDDGTQNLFRVPAQGGAITRPVSGRLMVYAYSVAKTSGAITAQVATVERPSEIYAPAPSGKLTQLTHTNDDFLSRVKVSLPEYVSFKSKDGATVHGYIYKPLDYVPGRKYPAILRPHGGPVWAYYAEWAHLPQLFAANGYLVLFPNPRGSTGYGQDYASAIFADWGHKDYEDDMAIVDYAVAQGLADPDKLGVGGWSYGGISTDFIVAQTQRFKCAISGAGAALFASFYGHDQYIRDYEYELGPPWQHPDVWQKISPFDKVANITTPTLFMGGEIDWNVPILGGEQMYAAMKSLGRETELVVYPGEYHSFKTPSHIKDRLQRYLAWYAHYVKADGTPARPPEQPPKAAAH
jgi:dipeptidyl aminopeptidase/acylaminoacyl peptidase